ncbi:glycosyl hydrolase family 88 [Coprinopsis cinerea AmutBmut pab1-1]|nr:glycosyl hydrolase family 88 [Coprinopsis cinerea AmutBmut pab1-1]
MSARWITRLSALTAVLRGFRNETIDLVAENMLQIAHASWELGAAAQALTEVYTPGLSVFEPSAFPPPRPLNQSWTPTYVFAIVNETLDRKPANSRPLFANQGSSADPASLGTAVLLANWTRWNSDDSRYGSAAYHQLDYLLKDAPRTREGAISHRADEVQLWSDYVYMVPPFIAYYGALHNDRNLLQIAYDQCRLYRGGLRDEPGLWRHVALGSWQDPTHWATGNAWAAAGMLRVLSTLNHSSIGHEFRSQQADLTSWVHEILESSWSLQDDSGIIHNVIDDPSTFGDTAATALLAASTYRYALFTGDIEFIPAADRAFRLVGDNINEAGWLENTVNPITFHTRLERGEYSPEGQTFVLLLHAAWRAFTESIRNVDLKIHFLPSRPVTADD